MDLRVAVLACLIVATGCLGPTGSATDDTPNRTEAGSETDARQSTETPEMAPYGAEISISEIGDSTPGHPGVRQCDPGDDL
jgi:hypothetical protein